MSTHNVTQIDRRALNKFKELGRGGFSTVYQVKYRIQRRSCLNKCSAHHWFCFEDEDKPIWIPAAAKKLNTVELKELELLSRLKHPYIVKLYGVVDELPEFYLVLELCEGGSLRSYLNKHKARPLNPCRAYSWGEQGALAVEYLHQQKVIHRDLKADNFLISRTKNLKLCDFGISKNAGKTVTTMVKGTMGWTAPENFSEEHVSPLSDLYAFAIVIWELLTRLIPFEGCEYPNIMHRVCIQGERPEIPADCPTEIAELLQQCWNKDRKTRPTIGHVVEVMRKFREEIQSKCREEGEILDDILPYTRAKVEVFYDSCIEDMSVQFDQKKPFQLHSLLQSPHGTKKDTGQLQSFLKIPHGTSVAQIKRMIDKDSAGKLHLFTTPKQDTELTDDQTLLDHKMCGETATIYLKIDLEVIIKCETGDTTIGISQRDGITAIKGKIKEKLNIQPEAQQLLRDGKTLHIDDSIPQFINKDFQTTFHLKCHEKISTVVKRMGKNTQGQTIELASARLPVYPSQSIKELMDIIQKDQTLSFKDDEALLFRRKILFTNIYKASKLSKRRFHRLLLEVNVKDRSVLHVEESIEVYVQDYSWKTGKRFTRHAEDGSVFAMSPPKRRRSSTHNTFTPIAEEAESTRSEGPIEFLVVFPSQTIGAVKKMIKGSYMRGSRDTRLAFEGTQLEDHLSISHYNICNGSGVEVEKLLQVCIHVNGEQASTFTVDAWESETIAKIKTDAGIPNDKKYLMLKRKGSLQHARHRGGIDVEHQVEDSSTCSTLIQSNGKVTLFLLERKHLIRIKLHIDASVFGSIMGYTATVMPCFTIQDLRDLLETSVPLQLLYICQNWNLVFEGQELENNQTLSSCNIKDGSTLEGKLRHRRASRSTLRDRRASGSTLRDRRASGSTLRDRRASGSTLRDRRASGSTLRDRRASGSTLRDQRASGSTLRDQRASGSTLTDRRASGSALRDRRASGSTLLVTPHHVDDTLEFE